MSILGVRLTDPSIRLGFHLNKSPIFRRLRCIACRHFAQLGQKSETSAKNRGLALQDPLPMVVGMLLKSTHLIRLDHYITPIFGT